jgi:hypothetical protein
MDITATHSVKSMEMINDAVTKVVINYVSDHCATAAAAAAAISAAVAVANTPPATCTESNQVCFCRQ